MKWNKVSYSRTYKIADYQSETILVEYTADEHEDMGADDALEYASSNVATLHGKLHASRPVTGQATITQKASGVATQQALPVTRQAPRPPPAAAQRPPTQTTGYNRLATGMAKPYTIQVPYKGPIDKDVATAYLKSLGYWFLGKKDGGDNGWHGEVFPDAMPELEAYMTKRPASQDPVGDAMGDDQINF